MSPADIGRASSEQEIADGAARNRQHIDAEGLVLVKDAIEPATWNITETLPDGRCLARRRIYGLR